MAIFYTANLVLVFLYVVFCLLYMLIFPLMDGSFVLSEWLSKLFMTFWICLCFSIPFVVLAAFNRRYFGKNLCVKRKWNTSQRGNR